MRSLFSALTLGTAIAAQGYVGEPPVLITNPPVTSPQFNAAALGGTGAIAQIQFTPMRDASHNILPGQWYITATLDTGTSYVPHAAVYNANTNTITPKAGDVATLVGAGTGFACNVSHDLLVAVYDVSGSAAPVVATRANATLPFGAPVPIGAPVPPGYRDSTVFDQVAPNQYEYAWFEGAPNRSIRYATIDVTNGTVLSAATTVVSHASVDMHSQQAMRQWTGLPTDIGKMRAVYYSRNSSSADTKFRSGKVAEGVVPLPEFPVYDAATGWQANQGNRGGDIYAAYAAGAAYGDPMKFETVSCSSAQVPLGGGIATLVGWSSFSASPRIGLIILGSLGASGINLSFLGVTGNLSLNPAALVFLPGQVFDPNFGEIEYDIGVSLTRPALIHLQVLMFNVSTGRIYLGNTAQVNVG